MTATALQDAINNTAYRGITGYEKGRSLTQSELHFKDELISLGINTATADELFRNGINDNSRLVSYNQKKISALILSISKNKHPLCPDTSKVHLSQVFADRLATLVEWIKFQPRIGASIDASNWNQNYSEKRTDDRVISELETEQSNAENDLVLPPALEEMNKFREFDESFKE